MLSQARVLLHRSISRVSMRLGRRASESSSQRLLLVMLVMISLTLLLGTTVQGSGPAPESQAINAQSNAQSDTTPTPTPTPGPSKTPTPPRTLADLAKDRPLNLDAVTKDGSSTIEIINDAPPPSSGGPRSSEQLALPTPSREEGLDDERTEEEKRDYWQEKYIEKVQQINRLRSEISGLDRKIPELQNKFYRWDDPAYRDGVIKPELDAAIERREKAREELKRAEADLPKILDAARRDGSEPGWFRGLDPHSGSTR